MAHLRKIAFVINEKKAGASDLGAKLMDLTRKAGVEVVTTSEFPASTGYLKGCDACCAIGGDGTLLGIAAEAAREQVPVIGVNRGSLGFLTTFSSEEALDQFPALIQGQFRIAYRSLLSCTASPGQTGLALNDVLIKDQVNSRLARLEVRADGELVTDYYCDGLIFSTPTGSTAYNLSAGGPIVHPGADVIAMTPICPHTLSNRSIIFKNDVCLTVRNLSKSSNLLVALDGQRNLMNCGQDPIQISLAEIRLPLAQSLDYSHFSVVRTKLKWSGGVAEKIDET